MKLINKFCGLFSRWQRSLKYERRKWEYEKIEKYLHKIKSNPVLFWNYIDSQKEGSLGWVMTREYRIVRAHEKEALCKEREIELYREMANRIKIIKDSEKEY